MSGHDRLARARSTLTDFTLEEPPGPNHCEYALTFSGWAEGLAGAALAKESVVAINQAKILLLDRYFAWLGSIPRRHTSVSGRLSHECVDVVFEANYRLLREAELRLEPPPLAMPPLPHPPPEPMVPLMGARFGDRVDGEEW